MKSAIRALLMIVGALLIVGATVIFLRDLGTVLPPRVSAALAFVVGVGLLWLAFRPERVVFDVREQGPDGAETTRPVETSYDRAALARLQESFDPDPKSPDRSVN